MCWRGLVLLENKLKIAPAALKVAGREWGPPTQRIEARQEDKVRKTYGVLATMFSRGEIVILEGVRKRCRFNKGDQFVVEDDPDRQIVTHRKVKNTGEGFEVYLQCPYFFQVPPRRKQFYHCNHELVG